MLKKANQKITRYEYESVYGLYYVDIIETDTEYEAWITGSDSGLSSFMFGESKANPENGYANPVEGFAMDVEALVDGYIEDWEDELQRINEMDEARIFES